MTPVERRDPALLDSPNVKASLARALAEARARTLAVLEPVSDDDLVRQHSPLMSPLVWDLAHIGFFEELWLVRRVGGEPPILDRDELYDAFEHERSERATLPLLSPAEAREYLERVRERALAVLERVELDPADPLLRDGYVGALVVQHEQQHVETMLATLNLRPAEYPFADPAPLPRAPLPAPEVLVEGGPFVMGTGDRTAAYANEREEHSVDVPAFWIDSAPVTNRAYLAFVDAGGYEDERLWGQGGWTWRQESGAGHPGFWEPAGEGSWMRFRLGRREELPLDEPVQHVCWHEADAFARWAGRRLPTEAEWEKAASWEADGGKRRFPWGEAAPDEERANLAFEAFPYAEYSEVFFGDEYKVLRGGSWATHPAAIRTTFRNWDYPIRRQIFSGFRTARDA